MVSAYILFLNPLILSGASAGANTGMPSDSVVAATAISTGVATAFMGVVCYSHTSITNAVCGGCPCVACFCKFASRHSRVNIVVLQYALQARSDVPHIRDVMSAGGQLPVGGFRPARHQHLLRPECAPYRFNLKIFCIKNILPRRDPVVHVLCQTPVLCGAQLIKPFKPCGAHSFLQGNDTTTANLPCTCTAQPDGSFLVNEIGEQSARGCRVMRLVVLHIKSDSAYQV